MSNSEYTFRIDVFTPDTLPMARLAEYMAALADLMGHKETTHFARIEEGSARLVSRVEQQDAPKVQQRLERVLDAAPPHGTGKAFKVLDDMLAEDNAVGEIIGPTGALIIPFPGRTRPKALTFPAFRQHGSIDGQIVSIGGRDKTAHVTLQDGRVTFTNIDLDRETARELAPHLYGSKVRLFGSGRWERHPEGTWKLLAFSVDHYEILDDAPLSAVLTDIRSIPPRNAVSTDTLYEELMGLRVGEDDVH
ncbi:hypothetical protein [Phenylobacterium sp.]|jgi:hypothetical protein|uniref:hypothetical protein n=1 Tax=Phenylobacterium sp. TaxID=1871053 RepID=UPI0029F1AB1A|nr:hypothetical protein [Phenylobacterium sp.]